MEYSHTRSSVGIFHEIMSVPHSITMDMNNVSMRISLFHLQENLVCIYGGRGI